MQLDDSKLQNVLKKMNLNVISGIEEVNIFKNDGDIIHIKNPKSKCSLQYKTTLVLSLSQSIN